MRRMTVALLAAVLVLTLGSAVAQPAPGQPVKVEKDVKMMMEKCRPGAELSREQQKQMLDLRLKFVKETVHLKADLEIKRLELEALWAADEPDGAKILAKAKEISNLRWQITEKRINHRLGCWKVLTPEQRQQMGPDGKPCCPMMGGMGPKGGMDMPGPMMKKRVMIMEGRSDLEAPMPDLEGCSMECEPEGE